MEVIGYIILSLSLITSGFLFIFEQKLLNTYYLEPLMVVGFEGLFGLIISICLVIIFSFVPCSFGVDSCVFNEEGLGFI